MPVLPPLSTAFNSMMTPFERSVAKGIYLVPTLCRLLLRIGEGRSRDVSGKDQAASLSTKSGFRKALAAGVKIAFGTDAGSFPHGAQAIEFEWMTRYGMTPLQAIQAATINALRI